MKLRELIADQRFQVGVVVLVAFFRLVNLGYSDLQPWDESLYAIRAQTVVKFGGWLDQTPHSIDGPYSSTHPPLYVWLTALAYEVFGVNEFSARFFSAIFGAGTIILVYFFGKRFFSQTTGLFAALFLGLNPFYTFWTRQGQFDVALVFFLTLSSLFYLLSIESTKPWRYYAAAGVAVGLGLMTKLFICLIFPFVALALMVAFDRSRWSRHLQAIIVSTVVALAIALPWHLMMTLRHGNGDPLYFAAAAQLTERMLVGIEENVKALGPLYYPNQLIVAFPYALVFFLYASWRTFRQSGSLAQSFLILWLLLYFIMITVMRTKLAVYILPLFVPTSLLAGEVVGKLIKQEVPRRVHLVLLILTLVSVGWSLKHEWRIAAKDIIASLARLQTPSTPDIYTLGLFLLLTLFSVLVLYELNRGEHSKRWLSARLPAVMFTPLFLLFVGSVAIFDAFRHNDGARQLRDALAQRSYSELYLVGAERNPQLTYYLEGADLGWDPTKLVMRLSVKTNRDRITDYLRNRLSQPGTFYVVVERYELMSKGITRFEEILPRGLSLALETRGYALFEKQELFAEHR